MSQTQKPQKEKLTLLYRLTIGFCRFLFCTLVPTRFYGRENLELDAPYILIANHSSMLDPFLAACHIKRYQVRFLGKRELTKNGIVRGYLNGMKMIAVNRGESDMAAMRACIKVLKEGHVLSVFPEGTRHKKGVMQDLEDGTGMIALYSRVPLLPVYIASRPRLFHRTEVYYDRPILLDDLVREGVSKESCNAVMDRIRERYAELVAAHPMGGSAD